MTPTLEISIMFLIFTTIIIGIILAVFIIKLLVDLSKLITNVDEVTTLVKQEVEPTLKELKETLNNINSIAKSADKQVDVIKKLFTGVIGASSLAVCGIKNMSGGFFKGLSAGLKLFKKK